MTTIPIDRSTIKTVYPHVPLHITGKLHYTDGVPECIKHDILVTRWNATCTDVGSVEFIVPDESQAGRFIQLCQFMHKPVLHLEITRPMVDVTCIDNSGARHYDGMPYETYQHEKNTPIPCSHCGKEVPYQYILAAVTTNEDGDEFDHDVCPHCEELDTFDYQFEKL